MIVCPFLHDLGLVLLAIGLCGLSAYLRTRGDKK